MGETPSINDAYGHPVAGGAKSTRVLLGVLLFVCMIFIAVRFVRRQRDGMKELRGDSDSAILALSAKMSKIPIAQREPLLLTYVQDISPGLRYAAVDMLGDMHDQTAADAVELAFKDSSSVVRQRALEVLPKLDHRRGVRLQISGLHDEDEWIREAAIIQLSLLVNTSPSDGKQLVPVFAASLSDPDPVVSAMAAGALRKVTRASWRPDKGMTPAQHQALIKHWQDWWNHEQAKWPTSPDLVGIAAVNPTRSDPAPDFMLRDVDGGKISLTAQHGRLTLLNFWGTWCPPCRKELPALIRLDRAYRGRKLDIIGVALGEKDGPEGLRTWCRAHGIEYRQALATNAVCDDYGDIHEVPVSILIDGHGRIRYRWEAERDYSTFSASIDRLLSEPDAI